MDYWERLRALCLMSLQRRRERFIVIMMWKFFHGLVPNDLNIRFQDSGRNGIKAVLPSYPRGCRSAVATQFDASFAYVGPKLWNVLPSYLRAIRELDEFKRKLTGFVLLLPDRPPIPGYSVANHNSLVDVIPVHGSDALDRFLRGVAGPPPTDGRGVRA